MLTGWCLRPDAWRLSLLQVNISAIAVRLGRLVPTLSMAGHWEPPVLPA